MAEYQRARSPEQKAERMEAIMDAAEGLFAELPYHEINMGLIAKELGWSRSNLYKYAATLEEVFLALHSRANEAYIAELMSSLPAVPCDDRDLARVWAKVTAKHRAFLRYQDILIAIIESNTSLERLVDFKRTLTEIYAPLTDLLSRQTGCSPIEARELYLRLIFQAPNLYSHHHPAGRSAEAIQIVGMPPAPGTFEDAYADFVTMCLAWVREHAQG
ncbi:TetR family transcriptional regulator [Collinsella vaginalis]|uniref:TetR family transcriptional regulator n=1 Tax=Collinsella vaginalis TaxID=1870987 RepID=UPI000A26F644|nr:TetR family transcriptional regulator [Collinsella vaginalis]